MSYAVLFFLALKGGKYFFSMQTPAADFSVRSTIIIVSFLFITRLAEYFAVKQLRIFGRNSHTVLFVGDQKLITNAYNDINIMPYAGIRIIGYYSDTPISNSDIKIEYLGTLAELNSRIDTDARISDDIYCTEMPENKELITRLVDYSMQNGIQFNYIPSLLNDFGYCLKPRIEGELVVFSNLNEPLLQLGNRIVKRTFDIVV